jgi:hypothetical protein
VGSAEIEIKGKCPRQRARLNPKIFETGSIDFVTSVVELIGGKE